MIHLTHMPCRMRLRKLFVCRSVEVIGEYLMDVDGGIDGCRLNIFVATNDNVGAQSEGFEGEMLEREDVILFASLLPK